MKVALIVVGVLIVCIVGAYFVSTSLGVAATIGGIFFMIVFGFALFRRPLRDEDELYDDGTTHDD
ncbi:hypothetical protein [Ferrimicrobium sp.]|uniref:hypothetical protein n=1 Tax=Ferrimicrobium sp. TaxID=2926050 RepID=UPI00261688E5|nr:hypothetical protein [Ferrimicrobium sp.]